MGRFSLTPRARAQLTAIFAWTIESFGHQRAEAYRDRLIERCGALASGEPPHGRSCNALLGDQANTVSDLQYYREGGHYIIFRRTPARLIVLEFIHQARNLEWHLRGLTRDDRE